MSTGRTRSDRARSLSTRAARSRFGELLDRARYQGEETVITKNGTPWAALVSIEELEHLRALEDAADRALIDEARRALEAGEDETVPWEEVKRTLYDDVD